ncbi:MAG: sigma-70 family RNA polymerase sigma factor [Kiritimatiellia bacterium]|nr:sigma-70 family RNA polymerase sigma factor [Kiritimatiellia bacterium]MDP6848571.1 sigma-70 family RNA polymerase sigma factor [Kiritimatiellia bacterium]
MKRHTLETLVRRHQAEIYRYMRYMGASPADAADLVQEAFLAAFRGKTEPDLSDDRGCAAWLRGIARNMFLRHWRRGKRNRVVVNSELVEAAENTWSDWFLRDGDGFETVEALERCLEKLPDKQRSALDMRYRDRESRSEMSELLKMTENGVKSLLRRIRAGLAECIEQRLAKGLSP